MSTRTARGYQATAEPLPIGDAQAGSDEFDIQWMPPGRQQITCFVGDEPREMDFEVKPEHALIMNSMLQSFRARAAAGESDEPFIDFNHEDGAASGHPTEMYWGGADLKKGGIRLRGAWTGSGKSAAANRDFTRFSPQWDFDAETDEPTGIRTNLGGLVNRAAFKKLQAVAASAKAAEIDLDKILPPAAAKVLRDELRKLRRLASEVQGRATTELGAAQAKAAAQPAGNAGAAQGRSPTEHAFVTAVKSIQAEKKISFAAAVYEARAKEPALAADYQQRQSAAPARAVSPADHPFLKTARTLEAEHSLSPAQAQALAAERDYASYQDYLASCRASNVRKIIKSGSAREAGEFARRVRARVDRGATVAQAASAECIAIPGLAQAYRRRIMSGQGAGLPELDIYLLNSALNTGSTS